jgi:putative transposase
MHDRDTKFTVAFDSVLQDGRAEVLKTPFRSPNLNAFVERIIQTLGQECLDYFVVFGARHLDHLCREFATYYHRQRPHQGKKNRLLIRPKHATSNLDPPDPTMVRCETRLGGLLRHYYRAAA